MLVRGTGFEDTKQRTYTIVQLTIYQTDDKVCENLQRVERGDGETERDSEKTVVFS